MDRMDYKITRCHGIVPECFKDDNASQWKSGKFDPAPSATAPIVIKFAWVITLETPTPMHFEIMVV